MKDKFEYRKLKRTCPICCGNQASFLGTLNATLFAENPLPSHWDIMSCNHCDFIFCDGDFTNKTLEEYYATEGDYWEDAEDMYDPVADRVDNPLEILYEYINSTDSKILDVGCGSGNLLQKFHKKGYTDLYGTDLGYIEKKGQDINFKKGDIYNIPFDKKFDVIISTHVLEHLYDINKAVASLVNSLEDEGILYLEVPDTERYFTENFTRIVSAAYEHINFFTGYNLNQLLTKYNMKIISTTKTHAKYGISEVPCIAIVAQKTNSNKSVVTFSPVKCAEKFYSSLKNINFKIKPADIKGKYIYVWGITRYLQIALHYLDLNKHNLAGLIDSSHARRRNTIPGITNFLPDHLKDAPDNTVVLINAFNAVEPIKEQLKELGFKGEVYSIW